MNRAFLTDIKELRRQARSHEEQGHADVIAERIVQLGGAPDMNAVEEGHAEDLRMLIDALSGDERGALRESGKS